MSSASFVCAVIARRFGYTAAAAVAIVEALNESERNAIETEARQHRGSAAIAAVIMSARTLHRTTS